MVNTIKFSQFSQGSVEDGSLQTVGLSNGVNSRQSRLITWTTSTRPAVPYAGLLGFNSETIEYEFWDGISSWIALTTGGSGVTAVGTGTGLTGGTITSTGVISFAPIAANSLWANTTNGSAVPNVTPLSTFLLSANNLSDISNIASARINLGLQIGVNVEAWNATLDTVAAGTYLGSTSISTLGTITSGLWNGATIGVQYGGTGANIFTSFSVICAGTSGTGAFQNVSGVGSTGQVLTSNGAGLLPTWQNAGSGTINSGLINQLAYYAAAGTTLSGLATANNATLITSAGGVPSISQTLPATVQGNITSLGTISTGTWNGTPITVSFGGTGNTTFTAYSIICAGTTPTGTFQNVSGLGLSGQVLTSNGAAALPTWQNVSGSGTVNSGLTNQLAYYAASGNTVSGLATANDGVLVTNNTGVPSILASPGLVNAPLLSNIGAAPVWSSITQPSTSATAGKIWISDGSNIIYSTPTFPNSATGTGTLLRADGTNWVATTSTYPNTNAINTLLYASSANVMAALATANNSVLSTNGTGVPSLSATLPSGISATNMNLTTPTLGVATATSIAFSPTTGGIIGTTAADNASSGFVGEYKSTIVTSGSAVNLSSNAAVNIATLSLTAGDWDVWGELWPSGPSGTSYTDIAAIISTSSATNVTNPADNVSYNQSYLSTALVVGTNVLPVMPISPCRINISSTTNVFLECFSIFTVHTGTAYGKIAARRVR